MRSSSLSVPAVTLAAQERPRPRGRRCHPAYGGDGDGRH